jgi:hypothetical protein
MTLQTLWVHIYIENWKLCFGRTGLLVSHDYSYTTVSLLSNLFCERINLVYLCGFCGHSDYTAMWAQLEVEAALIYSTPQLMIGLCPDKPILN